MSYAWRFIKQTLWWTPVVITVNDCICGQAVVNGRSMQPTLNPAPEAGKDRVLADKLSIRLYQYNRGDVVLLRCPDHPHTILVKRLLALEGDWVLVPGVADIQKIPKGHCWIEGDNPALSEDSRSKYGPVPLGLIEGRVTHVIWPPSRIGRITAALPPGRLLATNRLKTPAR
ncbi:hypothetical protein WJX72_011658 [[Myrmecia] bisecta]|uniref:Mitochondrial inner membrane protease subunit 2 n=1 Tax=[Myrmecia] bisecta TaxID=41462 RepID=A0AAW1QGW7_9CHLO